jgi:hypothetical protein
LSLNSWHAAVAELVDLRASYAAWLDALPESLRETATAQGLQAIADLGPRRTCRDRAVARIRPRLTLE